MTSLPSIVTVWPEFGPPHRTSQGELEWLARSATTLPLPSDPYCPPTTIVAGMATNISGRPSVVKRPYDPPNRIAESRCHSWRFVGRMHGSKRHPVSQNTTNPMSRTVFYDSGPACCRRVKNLNFPLILRRFVCGKDAGVAMPEYSRFGRDAQSDPVLPRSANPTSFVPKN